MKVEHSAWSKLTFLWTCSLASTSSSATMRGSARAGCTSAEAVAAFLKRVRPRQLSKIAAWQVRWHAGQSL